jgi:hypothetical protein
MEIILKKCTKCKEEKYLDQFYKKKNGKSKSQKTLDLIGCSLYEFKNYIESKFQIGMSWLNWTKKGWHLDHKIPCSFFDLTVPDNQRICFHWYNLQPLWGNENCKKNSKVPENVDEIILIIKQYLKIKKVA